MKKYGLKLFFLFVVVGIGQVAYPQQTSSHYPAEHVPSWYQKAIIYNIEVATFADSDGDGMGDFQGLTSKIGYLDSLGVDVIWLAPFHPSPRGDDGYDVADYFSVDPQLGTFLDFQRFMQTAKKNNIKVIMDAVLNHTSIFHPWYEAARSDPNSSYHDWYVWSESRPSDWDEGMVFPGVQNQTWSYDEVAKKFYFHRFYSFQPDLNFENPAVLAKAIDILAFWLHEGLDGFRLDAVPFIIDIPKTGSADPDRMFPLLDSIRNAVHRINPHAIILGEANVSAEENKHYFGENGERLHMMFNFYANQHLFYALASENVIPFAEALEAFRNKPAVSQWAYFLRNHDEIDLGRLTEKQREFVYKHFGPHANMQLYDRGIRKRLATMLEDPRRIEMAYSLLFALPGTPVLRYGEEIGMGDDLRLQERIAVRTPMQWDTSKHAGFTQAAKPFRPVIHQGNYRYQQVNVMTQKRDSTTLYSKIQQLIRLRKKFPVIGLGDWKLANIGSEKVFAMQYPLPDGYLLQLHNFSAQDQAISIPKPIDSQHRITDLLQLSDVTDERLEKIEGYGYRWYHFQKRNE